MMTRHMFNFYFKIYISDDKLSLNCMNDDLSRVE